MKLQAAATLRKYDKKNLPKDIIAGIIIAAVSIPISMGYAQIAGLPAAYGLYGSVFPILIFAIFSTSPQFIFGVDAAPAALVGSALLSLEIQSGSAEALAAVPVITFFAALWLMIFYLLKADKLVNYISSPVMGGFITGICSTIILMQIPKLMGGSAGVGEMPELLMKIYETAKEISLPSLILGVASLLILIISKKLMPKLPMAVILMGAGACLTKFLGIDSKFGIATLSAVEKGMPKWILPDFTSIELTEAITISLSIAVVIMAETLLAEKSFAQKNGYKVNENQELLAFSLGNFAAAFTGCCPINGSVSRTALSEQYQGKTQLTGLVAGGVMIPILIFGTGFIKYLPVPVLTAIVISALMGATEFHLAKRLWKTSRAEFFIFAGAFFGVLMLGTVNGVLIGIILSFVEMVLRTAKPPRCFMGIQPGHYHFRDLKESSNIFAISGAVIYKFSDSLFFANIDTFQKDIEKNIKDDTRVVIVDASGIGSIDITAADRIKEIYESLKKKDIKFYITEHVASLNTQLRKYGLGYMIEEGAVRRTVHIALKDMGINRPYPLDGAENYNELSASRKRIDNRLQEFSWAFGSESEEVIEKQIHLQIEQLRETGDLEGLIRGNWQYKGAMDEDEWIEHLEEHIKEIVQISGKDEQTLADSFEKRRIEILEKIEAERPDLAEKFRERRHHLDEHLKKTRPDVYEIILKKREKAEKNRDK